MSQELTPGGTAPYLYLLRRTILILVTSFGIVALFWMYDRSGLGSWLNAKTLERQVKRNVDSVELQQWATNLLAQHPGKTEYYCQYFGKNLDEGTNFPAGLRNVGTYSRGMSLFVGGRESSVRIFGITKDGPCLVVGPPALRADTRTNGTVIPWKPGIYFDGR